MPFVLLVCNVFAMMGLVAYALEEGALGLSSGMHRGWALAASTRDP
jgi:hypothetical protein